jgi:hypothetical protein
MIDRTNLRIEEMEEEIRRENDRRYAFYRMLNATDRVLWRLEEMNRDGVTTIPDPVRHKIRETVEELPDPCHEVFRDSDRVQETLDSIFELQESLFKWRNPEWALEEGDDLERAAS